eukprot:1712218-Prymnesium_polylepis.2
MHHRFHEPSRPRRVAAHYGAVFRSRHLPVDTARWFVCDDDNGWVGSKALGPPLHLRRRRCVAPVLEEQGTASAMGAIILARSAVVDEQVFCMRCAKSIHGTVVKGELVVLFIVQG